MAEELTSGSGEMKKDTVMGFLSYLGILWIIPYLTVKGDLRNEYILHHLKQGFTLLLFEVVFSTIARTCAENFLGTIAGLCSFVLFIFMILGIINACKGDYTKNLPLIGGLADKISSWIK